MLPVTGPFTKSDFYYGPTTTIGYRPVWIVKSSEWYRQKPPYSLELPYSMDLTRVIKSWGGESTDYIEYYTAFLDSIPPGPSEQAYNAAYSRLFDEIRSVKAELGATLGEWRQASSMITQRATQLFNGFRAARRGDISGVKRAWGKRAGIFLSKRKKLIRLGRNKKQFFVTVGRREGRESWRQIGSDVLEYSFGWAPLVQDLNNALEVLHNRIPPHSVQGKKTITSKVLTQHNWGAQSKIGWFSSTIGWSLRARIEVDNPNTALAQQLGLVNLASVAWELVPNSYIVDYFVNVNDFLGSFSDRVGIAFLSEFKTRFVKNEVLYNGVWNISPHPVNDPLGWSAETVQVRRTPGLPGPSLAPRLPWQMSVRRGLTSIARLLQLLKG